MRLINSAEVAVVSGGEVESGVSQSNRGSSIANSILLDAAVTHSPGQNSWGESVQGGAEFYATVLANAALDAASYERCMRENSQPNLGVKVAGGVVGIGVGATVAIISGNPALGTTAGTTTYGAITSLGVAAQQSNCTR